MGLIKVLSIVCMFWVKLSLIYNVISHEGGEGNGTPLQYSGHGILQARILEWVAVSSSRTSFRPRDQTHVS